MRKNSNYNYFGTYADWKSVDFKDIPHKEPDYISESGSNYWYTPRGIYRLSDHWGTVGYNIWTLDGQEGSGFVKLGYIDKENIEKMAYDDFLEYNSNLSIMDLINDYKKTECKKDYAEKSKPPYIKYLNGKEEWYNSKGYVWHERFPEGFEAWYDENHKLTHVIFSSGKEQWYDTGGNVIKCIDIDGEIIKYKYDQQGNLISKISTNGIINYTKENNQINNNFTKATQNNNKQKERQGNDILWFLIGFVVAGLIYIISKVVY